MPCFRHCGKVAGKNGCIADKSCHSPLETRLRSRIASAGGPFLRPKPTQRSDTTSAHQRPSPQTSRPPPTRLLPASPLPLSSAVFCSLSQQGAGSCRNLSHTSLSSPRDRRVPTPARHTSGPCYKPLETAPSSQTISAPSSNAYENGNHKPTLSTHATSPNIRRPPGRAPALQSPRNAIATPRRRPL